MVEVIAEKKQKKQWQDFYESAWDLRRQHMSKLIEAGEKDPLRIIKKTEQFERFYQPRYEHTNYEKTGNLHVEYYPLSNPEKDQSNVSIPAGEGLKFDLLPFTFLPSGVKAVTRATSMTEYHTTSGYTDYNKMAFVADYMQDKFFDAVIELGSGYSQNLFKLHYEGGPKIPYYGGEFTESGTACANMLAKLKPEANIQSFRYDFNNPDYSAIPKYDNVLVFTCHTIEQVELLSEETIPSIAKIAKNVHCIHFEPFGYQLNQGSNIVDNEHRKLFFDRKWNKNLMPRLFEAHKNGDIKLNFIAKNIFGSFNAGLNPTSLAVWSSSNEG